MVWSLSTISPRDALGAPDVRRRFDRPSNENGQSKKALNAVRSYISIYYWCSHVQKDIKLKKVTKNESLSTRLRFTSSTSHS